MASKSLAWQVCPESLYVSQDGGGSWAPVALPRSARRERPLRGGVVGTKGWLLIDRELYRSSDLFGATWTKDFVFPRDVAEIAADERQAVAVLEERKSVMCFSGKEWRTARLPLQGFVRTAISEERVFLFDSQGAFVGNQCEALRRATFQGTSVELFRNRLDRPQSAFLNGKLGWVIYESGFLFRTTDSGRVWTEIHRPTQIWGKATKVSSNRITFVSDVQGFLVGSDGRIHESYDGGLTWETLGAKDLPEFLDVSCFERTCLAVSRAGIFEVRVRGPMHR